jgi:hypothetical protein
MPDKEDWNKLYEYVKHEIFRYGDDMKLSRYCVQRLQGLRFGKFMNQRKTNEKVIYSYKVILITFKYKKNDIVNYIDITEFKDERHLINTVMKIVEGSLNDVVKKLKSRIETKKETQKVEIIIKNQDEKASYKKKKEKKNIFGEEDIW